MIKNGFMKKDSLENMFNDSITSRLTAAVVEYGNMEQSFNKYAVTSKGICIVVKAVIFDMDGVIIDSEPVQMKAINQVMAQWGIQLEEKDFIPMIGRRLADDYDYLKHNFGVPVGIQEFMGQKNKAYQGLMINEAVEMPGLTPLLKRLKSAGILIGIASGSCRADIQMIVKTLKIESYFQTLTSGDDVVHGKPHPEIYQLAASRLKVPVEECIAIEDTSYGVQSSKEAGMKCVAFPHPYTRHQDFSRADISVASLNEISLELLSSFYSSQIR